LNKQEQSDERKKDESHLLERVNVKHVIEKGRTPVIVSPSAMRAGAMSFIVLIPTIWAALLSEVDFHAALFYNAIRFLNIIKRSAG
jgi:hypothetical protein